MKINRNTLLLDVDGVILNWVDGFNKWIHKYHFKEHAHLNFKKDSVKDDVYDISERYGISYDILYFYIKLFNNSLDFAHLKALPDVDRVLSWFVFNNWAVHTVSSYSTEQHAVVARLKNLSSVMNILEYSPHYNLDLDSNKEEVLKKYVNAEKKVVFIDDKPEHVQEALDLGLEAYLFDQPYNSTSSLDRITWDGLLEKFHDY
jgi:FMN phosphatase YigB (HAD superfamily)